jgi:hypothetical protein
MLLIAAALQRIFSTVVLIEMGQDAEKRALRKVFIPAQGK